jgi:hypothetical protein
MTNLKNLAGSKRWPTHPAGNPRPNAEIVPSVSARDLRRTGLLVPPGEAASQGTVEAEIVWRCRSKPSRTATVALAFRPPATAFLDGVPVTLSLGYLFGANHPSRRWMFQCRGCGRYVLRLFRAALPDLPWACQRCSSLKSASHGIRPLDRAERALARALREGRERRPHEKRKGYIRRLARIMEAEAKLAALAREALAREKAK